MLLKGTNKSQVRLLPKQQIVLTYLLGMQEVLHGTLVNFKRLKLLEKYVIISLKRDGAVW